MLGVLFEHGIGVEEDKNLAKKLVLEMVKKGRPGPRRVHIQMTRDDDWGWYEIFLNEEWNPAR